MFKSLPPAVEAAGLFLIFALISAAADVAAQTNYITCRYIPTGVIQTFKGTQCPHDWVPM